MLDPEKRLASRLGKAVRRLRQARDWSQAELAERADISTDYVGLLERGLRLPALGMLVQLSEIFGVSTDEILGRSAIQDAWVTEATGLLGHVPQRIRAAVLGMLRAAGRE